MADRPLFRVISGSSKPVELICNCCGAILVGRKSAVWHGKRHEDRQEATVTRATMTLIVEERFVMREP